MTGRYPRIACAVPFCRRGTTRFPPGFWFLCANHWPAVDRKLKLVRAKARRRLHGERLDRFEVMIGRRMLRQAIERAAGTVR